ncbi:MAG: hypothetical protein HZA31_10470 [Opitutae bacterium]|nr:hypothetical protein [Opitutae bacterium]
MKTFVLAALASLSLTASAAPISAPAASTQGAGLIGQNYVGAEFTYVRFNKQAVGAPKLAQDYGFFFNQALCANMDLGLSYDYTRLGASGVNVRDYTANLDLTAHTKLAWGKPFVTGTVGWEWIKTRSYNENGFAYALGTGVEFQAGTEVSVAPFVSYKDTPRVNVVERSWNYGVRTNYRVNKEWSTTVTVAINNDKDMSYGIGLNYHF